MLMIPLTRYPPMSSKPNPQRAAKTPPMMVVYPTTYTNLVTMSNLSETSPDLTLFPNAKYTNAQMRDPIPRMTHPMTWSFISSSTTPQMMVRRAEMIIRIPTIHSAVPAVLVLSRNDIVG